MNWNIRIGINPLSWSNDDLPALGGDTPLETALYEGKEIGYEGFELGVKFPKDGPGLKAKLDAFGLACVSGWYSGLLAQMPADPGKLDDSADDQALAAEIQCCQAHMEKLRYNNVEVVVYGEGTDTIQCQIDTPLRNRPRFATETHWQHYAQRLNAFGAYLLDTYQIKLAYHHHMGNYVETPEDIDKLMALTDSSKVFLLFDTGHAYFGGDGNVVDLLKKHSKRIAHVHCKDVRPSVIAQARNNDWSFLTSVLKGAFTVPGDGCIDYAAILHILCEAGYKGWLVVEAEQDPALAPSYAYAQKGFQTLRGLVNTLNH